MKLLRTTKLLSVTTALVAALLGPLAQAAALPAGTMITGTANGQAGGLLGLDQGFQPVPGSNITALAAADLEYLSSDFGVGIDFFTDGSLLIYDNTGTGSLAGTVLEFTFAGLGDAISGFALLDLSAVTAGTITPLVIDAQRVRISFSDLVFDAPFASFSAQIVTSAVPEPGALALACSALALLWGSRRNQGTRASA